ncbi:MAG: prepilin-type N-terminal cleavage/methylation domain-containing protein [Phycisphaerae bacterium]
MRRRAFTLVELMVVISIISLLTAILLPSMSSIYSLARATICRGNLRRLSDAFSISSGGKAVRGADSYGAGRVVSAFPEPMGWPTIPSDAVADEAIYTCPEDPVKISFKTMLKALEYKCPYGFFPLTMTEGMSTFYHGRRGSDEKGSYTEYHLQDDEGNGQLGMFDWHGWYDIDGFVRVYDTGLVWIPSSIPDTPQFSGAYVINPGKRDGLNTCGDINAIYYNGQPAFGPAGMLRDHRDEWHQLPNWRSSVSNYGINSYAYEYAYGDKCIVLVDYKELIVEVDKPIDAEEKLLNSARHLGEVNYLRADGAVKTASPMDISPRLNLPAWRPDEADRDNP